MKIALTRMPTDAVRHCELTHLEREPIDVTRARDQHAEYERQLEALGCRVERLPELPEQPDAVFVEDTVVVVPQVAVITRPGAVSRRPEIDSMAEAMSRYRPLAHIRAPGTLDGGDVLRLGKTVYVGISGRTNESGFDQLRQYLEPHGYRVIPVAVSGCLHLKTAAADLGHDRVLVNPEWIDPAVFEGRRVLDVHPDEQHAVSVLRVGRELVLTAGCPRTRRRMEKAGCRVREIDYSELAKAEAGLTCCSVILENRRERAPA